MQADNIPHRFADAARFCLSKDDCIAQGIDFSSYEKGMADAIAACQRLQSEAVKPAANSKAQLYLNVPFAEKEQVKSLGGRWDSENKKWFVPHGVDITLFEKWSSSATSAAVNPGEKSKRVAGKAKSVAQKAAELPQKTGNDNLVVSRPDDEEIDLPW